jgi:uncharacterized protein (DUF488 family)
MPPSAKAQHAKPKLPTASPKQQLASKTEWNATRTADKADFFTLGFSGKKLDEILLLLKQHSVQTLVDIRSDAISLHRPELSKKNLAKSLTDHHLAYAHVPELGIPREVRAEAAKAGTRDVLWKWYDKSLHAHLANPQSFLAQFKHPVVLMCTELDPVECHRHRLALLLEKSGLKSFDL